MDLLEVCRSCNDVWYTSSCLMRAFGCDGNHALKDCVKVCAAVWKHPAFDLQGDSPLNSFIGCGRCECTGGDGYIYDGDGDNIVDLDHDSSICGHCDGTCWCGQRYWVGGEGYFDFERGVEMSESEWKRKVCLIDTK